MAHIFKNLTLLSSNIAPFSLKLRNREVISALISFFEGGVFLFSEETVLFNVLVSIQQYQFPLPRRVDYVKPRNVNHTRNFFCFPWSQLPLEIANSIAIHMVIWLISGCIHVPLKGKAVVSRPTRGTLLCYYMPCHCTIGGGGESLWPLTLSLHHLRKPSLLLSGVSQWWPSKICPLLL